MRRDNIIEKDGDKEQHINKKNYTIDTLDIPSLVIPRRTNTTH